MNKAAEIVEILGSEGADLVNALIKAQILAAEVGDNAFAQWVKNELLGYPADAELPAYRVLNQTVLGNVSNAAHRHTELVLPLFHLKDEHRKMLTTRQLREGIAELQAWVGRDNLASPMGVELASMFNGGLDPSYRVERAWGKLSVGAVEGLLVQVRSRLLEFALEVKKILPPDDGLSKSEVHKVSHQVSDAFQGAIFGDNATIQIGSGHNATIHNSVVKNDLESLKSVLRGAGVEEKDLVSLGNAVAADGDISGQKSLGHSVRSWMARLLAKAAEGSWTIGVGAAGNLLASALGAFYGFPI